MTGAEGVKSGLTDEELLKRGGECFDALQQQLRK
jgi:hypothetical protein